MLSADPGLSQGRGGASAGVELILRLGCPETVLHPRQHAGATAFSD